MAGARELQTPKEKKTKHTGLIVAGCVLAGVLCAYTGLCAWVGASGTILPNVAIAGVDVSGMTAEEAQQAVEQAVAEHGDEIAVKLTCKDWSGALAGADLDVDWGFAADAAYDIGRSNFFTQGASYLSQQVRGGSSSLPRGGVDSQSALNDLLDQADQAAGSGVTQASYEVLEDQLSMTKGVTGVAIDREQVWPEIMDAFDRAFQKKFAEGREGQVSEEIQLSVTETAPQTPDFSAIYQEVRREPVDARMDPETYEVTPHVVGLDFDMAALKMAYEKAGEGETFSIPLNLTQPKETAQSLEGKLFNDLLGEATSRVGGSSNRKTNVKLSAAACNGKILMPGEVFSYNNTTGSRSADKGYLPAPIYVGGKSQDDTGGGICQTSSTIYYAVLHTTLEIVERHDHQFSVGYVPDGMDATVFYGSLDFRFKNNTDYPVKIVTQSYDKGGERYLTVKLYGTNVNGRYAVPERTQFNWVQPTNKYVADSSVARGSLVLDRQQYAYTGRSAHTYRYIYEKNGTLVEKQDMGGSKYAMRPNLYYYNPLDGDPASWVGGKPPKQEKPVAPVQPETPTTPTEPEVPVTPEVPVEPETPVTPEVPVEPETPAEPELPEDPNAHLKPGELPDGF